MPTIDEVIDSPGTRAFGFLGLDLRARGTQAGGDCPFCGKEGGKFSVNVESGLWGCKRCGRDGNPVGFLRALWEASDPSPDLSALASERGFLEPATPVQWGCRLSVVTGELLVPGWARVKDKDGDGHAIKLWQLCRWIRQPDGSRRLLPCPGVHQEGKVHGLFGLNLWDDGRPDAWACEGCWDGMAVWEVVQADPELAARTNVTAVPGANVFRQEWASLFKGKNVTLPYDSDHPRKVCAACRKSWSVVDHQKCPACGAAETVGGVIQPVGLAGVKRVAAMLGGTSFVGHLEWGPEGFHPEAKSGYDVRDWLTSYQVIGERVASLRHIMSEWVKPVPKEWVGQAAAEGHESVELESAPCSSWSELLEAWGRALRMRQDLQDALAVLLAVCLSTEQEGDGQLFLQLIASAGSAKTKMCDGLLVSKRCKHLEHITGFHSGYNDGTGKDYSFIGRANKKTMITPEGDVLVSSPKFQELMSQIRRIFDGTAGSVYKTRDDDLIHTGLRTPWIMAGTPAILDHDQSRLGDRFLRMRIDPPGDEERRAIQRKVISSSMRSVQRTVNGVAGSNLSEDLRRAYRLTGGFVDWLRGDPEARFSSVILDEDGLDSWCSPLAEFVADMRARPNPDKRKEDSEADKEIPTRLTDQFCRLACCLAAVLGKREVDGEVRRIVTKVGMDTAHGRVLQVAGHLRRAGEKGVLLGRLSADCGRPEDGLRSLLEFMAKIKLVDVMHVKTRMMIRTRYRLTERLMTLWGEVLGA